MFIYCNHNLQTINNITLYCFDCNMVYIKDHPPYNLDDYDDYYDDKYEEYKL